MWLKLSALDLEIALATDCRGGGCAGEALQSLQRSLNGGQPFAGLEQGTVLNYDLPYALFVLNKVWSFLGVPFGNYRQNRGLLAHLLKSMIGDSSQWQVLAKAVEDAKLDSVMHDPIDAAFHVRCGNMIRHFVHCARFQQHVPDALFAQSKGI